MGTNFFNRDVRDLEFLLFEHLDIGRILSYDAYRSFSQNEFRMMIGEALKVARGVLGPAMQDGDREGCVFEGGRVRAPRSFHGCWRFLAENGWMATTRNSEYGGQGLPAPVGGLVNEILFGANPAMMMYPGLTQASGSLIEMFGTDEDRKLFVEKMYTGVWAGTMCLTEPETGSDVGFLKTRAEPDPEAGDPRVYRMEGTKQFISSGEHDLTENIIHLVLARIKGAPSGTRGISLFVVPKIRVNRDGSLGEPNDVACTGIEHKMGLHGSATCGLAFGENGRCRGILLGEPHSGMKKMFQVMNEARLAVGLLSVAAVANAYDTARAYARERIQGTPFADYKGGRVAIIKHEDVRRMLMNLKAGSEAMRAMVGTVFYLADVSQHDPDEGERGRAGRLVDLFTPVVKAYCSDFSYALTREAIQVLGGVGYCREFPAEQYARDCKMYSIGEGTTYIQALDLVGRKLAMEGGEVFREWIQGVISFAGEHESDGDFGPDFKLLHRAAGAVADFPVRYLGYFQEGRLPMIALTATRFQECMAEVLMGRLVLEQGLVARERLKGVGPDSRDGVYYRGKIETAKYFCRNILVNVFSRHASLEIEDTSALDIPEEAL